MLLSEQWRMLYQEVIAQLLNLKFENSLFISTRLQINKNQ